MSGGVSALLRLIIPEVCDTNADGSADARRAGVAGGRCGVRAAQLRTRVGGVHLEHCGCVVQKERVHRQEC